MRGRIGEVQPPCLTSSLLDRCSGNCSCVALTSCVPAGRPTRFSATAPCVALTPASLQSYPPHLPSMDGGNARGLLGTILAMWSCGRVSTHVYGVALRTNPSGTDLDGAIRPAGQQAGRGRCKMGVCALPPALRNPAPLGGPGKSLRGFPVRRAKGPRDLSQISGSPAGTYAPSLRQPAKHGGYAASRAADFTVSANWRLSRSTSFASAPSTMTRMTGSVPEARNNTRPWSASSFSASRTARITWLD